MVRIAVLGGGAAGLAAAVTAAEAGADVTLFEAKPRVGSSILATGNGRCNVSNTQVNPDVYRNNDFVAAAMEALPPRQVWEAFRRWGLVMREEAQGRMYPATNKASTVLDVLRFAAEEAGVDVICDMAATSVVAAGSRQLVKLSDGNMAFFDRIIVATGGDVAQGLMPAGYEFHQSRVVLCGLETPAAVVKGLDNVRVRCRATLQGPDGAAKAEEPGEVQFRKYGVSGVVIFNLSRFAEVGDTLVLDLLPEQDIAETEHEIAQRWTRFANRDDVDKLAGMLLPQVARCVLRQAGREMTQGLRGFVRLEHSRCLQPHQGADVAGLKAGTSNDQAICHMQGANAAVQKTKAGYAAAAQDACGSGRTDQRLETIAIARAIHGYRLPVTGLHTQGGQVHRGGFAVEAFDPATMASRNHPGLYLVGEALDVDGPCGGYNLHWAWTSGMLAGRAAARED